MSAVTATTTRPTITPTRTRSAALPECRCPVCNKLLIRAILKRGSIVEAWCPRCEKHYLVEAG